MDCVAANVFDLLPQLEKQPKKYDFIILDPPAFTKSRKTVHSAMTGYKEINYRAMKLLPRGGYLATCSCSHFATEELFVKMLRSAARDAGVQLRLACAEIMDRQGHPEPTGQGAAAADRGAAAVRRPPHPVGRGGDELSEILPFPGGVKGFVLPRGELCGILRFTEEKEAGI